MKRLAHFVSQSWQKFQEKRKERLAFEESVQRYEARQEVRENRIGFGTSIYVDPSNKILGPDELPEELRFKPLM